LLNAKPVEPIPFDPCIWPPANYHIDIGFWQTDGDGSCLWGRIEIPTVIFDIWLRWKASCLKMLQCVSFFLISVSKLWDMIIILCMCKGRTHHVNVLESTSHCMMAKTFSFFCKWLLSDNAKAILMIKCANI
jgi:hypothetical protein